MSSGYQHIHIGDQAQPDASYQTSAYTTTKKTIPRKKLLSLLVFGLIGLIVVVCVVLGANSSTFNDLNSEGYDDVPTDPTGRGDDKENMTGYKLPKDFLDGTNPGISTKALCNNLDDSYYFLKDANNEAEERNYVLYMPGGASCQSNSSCEERFDIRHEDMEGPSEEEIEYGIYGRGITQSGEFNEDKENSFKDWNLVHLHYCSSDSYIGRMDINDIENPVPEYHFGGDAIYWGMIEGMLNDHGMRNAENIFITSSSAGALGIFQQMDRTLEYLKINAPNAKVKFAYDNGWHLHGVPQYETDNQTLTRDADDETTKKEQIECWRPNIHDKCADFEESYMCFYTGDILYDYLDNKDFWMHLHEFDQKGYGAPQVAIDTWDDSRFEYAVWLAGVMVESLLTTNPERTSFTMPGTREHDSFDKSDFQEEYMPLTQQDEDYWASYQAEGVPDDAFLLCDYMKMFVDEVFDTPVRVYDACLFPYCNPTAARLPYDEDWDPDATDNSTSTSTSTSTTDSEEETYNKDDLF